jgi:hypothetical protein
LGVAFTPAGVFFLLLPRHPKIHLHLTIVYIVSA